MTPVEGVIVAYRLDGQGGATEFDAEHLENLEPGPVWFHLDRTGLATPSFLRDRLTLDPLVVDALLAEETRPRMLSVRDGLLVILRGVNLNPGADPEDMVAVRIWLDQTRIITSRARKVMAVADLRKALEHGRGPKGPGDFLVQLAWRLVERMGSVIEELDDQTDDLEHRLDDEEPARIRGETGQIRRTAIALRRYLAPQREATNRLFSAEPDWLDARHRASIRELADRVLKYVEDLDSIRERAAVVQDEAMARVSEQMNHNMYILSVVAAILLPLSFLTGLLGINVGGIPGADNPWGFEVVTTGLVVSGILLLWLFRRLGWL